jgi:hypothetical protein
MDMQPVCCRSGIVRALQPGQQRFGEPVLLVRPQSPERGEHPHAKRPDELLIGEDHQRGHVLGALDQTTPPVRDSPLGESQPLPGPPQRTARRAERYGRPHRRWPAAQPAFEQAAPARAIRIRHQQVRVASAHVDEHVRRQGKHRPDAVLGTIGQGHRGHLAGQGPVGRPGEIGDRRRSGRRVSHNKAEQLLSPAVPLPHQLSLGLRIAG